MVSQAAAIASTTQELTLPRKERVIRDEQKQAKQRELNIIFNRVGEGTPLTVDYSHPVFFKVKGGAELPSHLLGGCIVLNVDVLCIRLPSSPDAGLVCHSSKSNNPVFILTPRRLTLEKLGVHNVNSSHDLVSTLEKVISVQKTSTVRGCRVICEERYTGGMGVTVPRGQPGVNQFFYYRRS